MNSVTINMPALAPIEAQVSPLVERAQALTVASKDDHEQAQLVLKAIAERERFIEAFWRKRDPNPATPVRKSRK